MEVKKLTWGDVESAVDAIAAKVKASGFEADYIIGVTTGGLIPLYLLASKLSIENILTISATKHEGKEHRFLTITNMPQVDLTDKKIILVDDITEHGSTLREMVVTLKDRHEVGELKTVTIAINTEKTEERPDFYAIEKHGEWLAFPWESEK